MFQGRIFVILLLFLIFFAYFENYFWKPALSGVGVKKMSARFFPPYFYAYVVQEYLYADTGFVLGCLTFKIFTFLGDIC